MSEYSLNIEATQDEARLIEVSRNRDIYVIHACGIAKMDSTSKTRLHDSIKHTLAPKTPQEKSITTSLWSPLVVARRIQLPVMTMTELQSAIKYEFEKHIPYPVDDCQFDYYVVRRLPSSQRMEVMLVSAKKDIIEQRRRLFADSGWDLNFIDIHPFALANVFGAFNPKGRQGVAALIHIGDTSGHCLKGPNFVCILKDGQPAVVRDLGQETTKGDQKIPSESIDRIGDALRNSIDYYENSSEEAVNDYFISGQGALSEDLISGFGRIVENNIQTFSVKDKLQFKNEECRTRFGNHEQDLLILMGCAVRGLKA